MSQPFQPDEDRLWFPERHSQYDQALTEETEIILHSLRSNVERATFLRDTRPAHNQLYRRLTPPKYPEYGGTYRGTPETSLQHRSLGAMLLGDRGFIGFPQPENVAGCLAKFNKLIDSFFAGKWAPHRHFELASRLFYTFGLIHPYLNGNGHIQRLIFTAAIMAHPDLGLKEIWTVHPRPYGDEMKAAFEMRPGAESAVSTELRKFVR